MKSLRFFAPAVLALVCACKPGSSQTGSGGSAGQGGNASTVATGATGASATATASGATTGAATTAGSSSTGNMIDPCAPIPGASYTSIQIVGSPTPTPPGAAMQPDLNAKMRGWEPTGGSLGFVTYGGATDSMAPRLNTIFPDGHIPAFTKNYTVNDWNWTTMMPGGPITDYPVTLTDFASTPGEVLDVPNSGYQIAPGYQVHVLFIDTDSIVLKYTGEDNVVSGYTIHVFGICAEPSLTARYQSDNAAGRTKLPALAGKQAFGRARGTAISVAIRDTGAFMDPRSQKDWWP